LDARPERTGYVGLSLICGRDQRPQLPPSCRGAPDGRVSRHEGGGLVLGGFPRPWSRALPAPSLNEELAMSSSRLLQARIKKGRETGPWAGTRPENAPERAASGRARLESRALPRGERGGCEGLTPCYTPRKGRRGARVSSRLWTALTRIARRWAEATGKIRQMAAQETRYGSPRLRDEEMSTVAQRHSNEPR
jgi:hypothetical protein